MTAFDQHQVVTANRLSDGAVVYFVAAGTWSEVLANAKVADGEEAAAALLAQAETREEQLNAVGPYLMAISLATGLPRPKELREEIRAKGPTIHPNLGKQAESAAQGAAAVAG